MNKFFIFMICQIFNTNENHWGFPEDNHIVEMTIDNFKDFYTKHEIYFVYFYKNDCQICEQILPDIQELGKIMKEDEQGIPVVRINGSTQQELVDKFSLHQHPQLFLRYKKLILSYSLKLEAKFILEWARKIIHEQPVKINNQEEWNQLKQKQRAVLLLMNENNENFLFEMKVHIQNYTHIEFGYSTDENLFFKYRKNENSKYIVIFHREFDDKEEKLEFDEIPNEEQIYEFIHEHYFSLIKNYQKQFFRKLQNKKNNYWILFLQNDKVEFSSEYQLFSDYTQEHNNDYQYYVVDSSSEDGKKLLEFYGLKIQEVPLNFIILNKNEERQKYKFSTKKFEPKQIEEQLKEGKAQRFYKSEEVPIYLKNNLNVIVGANFEREVLKICSVQIDRCLDVIKFFIYLGDQINDESLRFTMFDQLKNEHSKLKIKKLPTLILYKPEQEPIQFDNDLSNDNIIEFIKKETGLNIVNEFKVSEDL